MKKKTCVIRMTYSSFLCWSYLYFFNAFNILGYVIFNILYIILMKTVCRCQCFTSYIDAKHKFYYAYFFVICGNTFFHFCRFIDRVLWSSCYIHHKMAGESSAKCSKGSFVSIVLLILTQSCFTLVFSNGKEKEKNPTVLLIT